MRQLTHDECVDSNRTRISRDGAWVYYRNCRDLLRIAVATGAIERVNAFVGGDATSFAPDATGARTAMLGHGIIGKSQDYTSVFLAQNAKQTFTVAKSAPTVLTWDPDPQSLRYDVIRGDVANLAMAASTVNLGSVTCVEDDSPDNDTAGNEDATQPAPGQVFFYLYRGTTGSPPVTGSYGQGTGGKERVAGGGACNP